ncbi:tail fiber protein [Xenorhabdus stockiae]|uniref:phage tail protein n=1 Tax=Xenorhabdus stockiae TaxID=351614 RepID=UPI003CEC7D0B
MQDKKPDVPVSDDSNLVIVTTPEYVKESIKEAIAEHAASRNHPDATLQDKGFVVLSNDTGSDSETMAATPKAVKAAYDLANTANQNASSASNLASTANHKADNASDLANAANNLANTANENANLALPVGVPVPWPTENPPEGWLICNGETFDKGKYPKLAFAYPSGILPDLRGEFIRGLDNGRGIDPERALLSEQKATMLPSVFTYKNLPNPKKPLETGMLVTPPISAYKTEDTDITDFMAQDFDDAVYAPSGSYLTSPLLQGGVSSFVSFRVRPRNVAFNYIVRAA